MSLDARADELPLPLVFGFFLAVAVTLHWAGGAFQAEFSSHADEPAHYVTGLMVRDYIAAGLPAHPVQFAWSYYRHYPKVALGHWPPAFYVLQAAWTLPFSPSRASLMLLMSILTALAATRLCQALRGDYSTAVGIGAGLLLLSLPTVQYYSRSVMLELPLAILIFEALLAFGRYLDEPNRRHAVWFGIWSSLAILTKGTGFSLALVPPLSVLLSRRFCLLRRFSFWLPVLIVVALCGPWYLLVPGAQHENVARFGGPGFSRWRLQPPPMAWNSTLGVVVSVLATLGCLIILVAVLRRTRMRGHWTALVSVVLSVYLFRAVIMAWETRHLAELVMVFVMLAVAGAARIFAALSLDWLPAARKAALAWALLAALVIYHVADTPRKRHFGFQEVAQDLLARSELRDKPVLVASDSLGEGMFISEIAMREQRPGHTVFRADRLLADSSWMGGRYRALVHTPEDLLHRLEVVRVGAIVVDRFPVPVYPHDELLWKALEAHPQRWELLQSYPDRRPGTDRPNRFALYRFRGPDDSVDVDKARPKEFAAPAGPWPAEPGSTSPPTPPPAAGSRRPPSFP